MPATYTAQHLFSRAERRLVDFDPPSANAELVVLDFAATAKCIPIANFRRFAAIFSPTVGTGGVTVFRIIAATAADGTGNTVVVQHALGSNPDAVDDRVCLECDVEQIHEVLATATHVGVEIDLVTGTDEGKVYFERAEPRFPASGLTADYIS
jgi:hypothetical protein